MNKTSTRVELYWNLNSSALFDEVEKARIRERLGKRVDSEGWVRVVSAATRSQFRNRTIAEETLVALLRKALHVRRTRKATRRTSASERARMHQKRMHSLRKESRRQPGGDD